MPTPAKAALFAAFMDRVWHPAGAAVAAGDAAAALRLLSDGIWGRPVFDSLPPQRQAAALRNAAAMRALVQMPDPFPDFDRAAVAALAMPVLVIRGEHASALHRRVIDVLARVAGAAKQAVIAGAGHASPQENPQAFNAALRAHLLRGRHAGHR